MTRLPRPILSGLITLVLMPASVHAAGFGELVRQSAIGEPFRAEFEILGTGSNDCVRVVPSGINDGIPDLRGASVRVIKSGRDARLLVTRSQPVSDPILRVTLEETCNARLLRTYTLLLPMQTLSPNAPAASPTRGTRPAAAPISPADLGGAYTVGQSVSLNLLARTLYPSSRSSRSAFIASVRELNRGDRNLRSSRTMIAPGTTFMLPSLDQVSRKRDAMRAQAQASVPAQRTPRTSPPKPATTPSPSGVPVETRSDARAEAPGSRSDRLVLMGGAPEVSGFKLSTRLGDPTLIERTSDAERDILRREQQLIMALDSQIVARLELSDRIERLEALQNALRAEMGEPEPAATASPETSPPPATESPSLKADEAKPAEKPPAPAITAPIAPETPLRVTRDESPWWPYGLAFLALLVLLVWHRRRRTGSDVEDTPSLDELYRTPHDEPAHSSVIATVAPNPSASTGNDSFDFSRVEWEPPPPSELDRTIAPIVIEEDELVEEHESAVELADIMMSFGRVQGAAETLADFIRGNPKKAVQPWIKLLEVYKTANMRSEFDALSDRLNKTFNVKAVTWESFDQVKRATESIEQLPHILRAVQDQWMTEDCQIYLQKLIRDNRGGTREGFPLGIVDDLLTLQAILEDQLGPYHISDEEIESLIAASAAAQAPAGGTSAPRDRDSLAPELEFNELPSSGTQNDEFKDIFDSQSSTTLDLPDLDFQLDMEELPAKKSPRDDNPDFERTRIFRHEDKDGD